MEGSEQLLQQLQQSHTVRVIIREINGPENNSRLECFVQKHVFEGVSTTLAKDVKEVQQTPPPHDYKYLLSIRPRTLAVGNAFINWLISRKLPRDITPLTLVQCWTIASQYAIPELQDTIMIALLRYFEKPGARITEELFSEVANYCSFTDKNPAICELLVEELVKNVHDYTPAISQDVICDLDDIPFVTLAAIRIGGRWATDRDSFFHRFEKRPGADHARWEDFLSADGVKTMWKRDASGEPITGEKRKRSDGD